MINLYLLGKKGLEAIERLSPDFFDKINAIIIGTDPAVLNDYANEIKSFAQKNNILFFLRKEIKSNIQDGVNLNIAIGWRWLIPLNTPLIVFHDSILPTYRGFNPLVTALINGDRQLGVTALFGTAEFDKGDIIAQKSITIDYPIKIETAIDLLSKEYATLLTLIFQQYLSNTLVAKPQNESDATYSLWRDEEDYHINWMQDSSTIKRMVDAVGFPYKGAYSYIENQKFRIFDVEEVEDVVIVNRTPGKVIFKENDVFVVVCGKGLLKIQSLFDDSLEKVTLSKFRVRFK
jgi:methionyl-tRNA formyltransferase